MVTYLPSSQLFLCLQTTSISEYITASEDKINIIKHCRKSTRYHNEELWIKKVLEIASIIPWDHSRRPVIRIYWVLTFILFYLYY